MFPSDWSERKGLTTVKRRKTQHGGEVRQLLEECGLAVGALAAESSGFALGLTPGMTPGLGGLTSGESAAPVTGSLLDSDQISGSNSGRQHSPGSPARNGIQNACLASLEVGLLGVEFPENVVDVIVRRVNDSKFAPPIPEELQLDHVLSSVPYQSMLESLFGGLTTAALDVPLVTKAYEESYMREAGPGEPSCALGELCECMFIDRNAPFVGVQFKLPVGSLTATSAAESSSGGSGSFSGGSSHGVPGSSNSGLGTRGIDSPIMPGMCVLCCRKTTQKLFYDICYSGNRVQGLIQQYGNLCNQPGEYARCCMLVCPPTSPWHCMPRPMMSHQRNRYQVHVVAGLKHLQQLRVAFEDFAPPSDTMQA